MPSSPVLPLKGDPGGGGKRPWSFASGGSRVIGLMDGIWAPKGDMENGWKEGGVSLRLDIRESVDLTPSCPSPTHPSEPTPPRSPIPAPPSLQTQRWPADRQHRRQTPSEIKIHRPIRPSPMEITATSPRTVTILILPTIRNLARLINTRRQTRPGHMPQTRCRRRRTPTLAHLIAAEHNSTRDNPKSGGTRCARGALIWTVDMMATEDRWDARILSNSTGLLGG